MPSHGQVAAQVRRQKEEKPKDFCPNRRCLWRVWVGDGAKMQHRPCPKHQK